MSSETGREDRAASASEPDAEFTSVGQRLVAARQTLDMTLQDVAAKTRIPVRHLQAIDDGKLKSLPGRTYAIGFARAYARAVDVPEEAIAAAARTELGDHSSNRPRDAQQFDIDEPSKVPSARIAWLAAALGAVILISGFGIWRTYFFPGVDVEEFAQAADTVTNDATPAARGDAAKRPDASETPASGPAPEANGEVVFTATEDGVWVKFYDVQGTQMMQKQMALGEQYAIPADANGPQIWTGRPDAFEITIGGRPVPPLGTSEVAIKDVPVGASALLSRDVASQSSTQSPTEANPG
ncbi:helix-turn-helix domain-containing protein [Blastomonas sp.]|uniref:helix-turn-helix domain-containing protein n=1 Tax=Blastomonas sp. TaxID=1909299 RepID=UPI0035942046